MTLCSQCQHALSAVHIYSLPQQLSVTLALPPHDGSTTRKLCWICCKLSAWLETEHPDVFATWTKTSLDVVYHRDSRQYSDVREWHPRSLESRIFQIGLRPLLPDGSALPDWQPISGFLMPVRGVCTTHSGLMNIIIDTSGLLITFIESSNVISSSLQYHQRREESTVDLPMVQRWMQICSTTHDRCKLHLRHSTPWYPTRLLRLSDGGRAMKLVMTDVHTPSGPYMTLSHRWGPAEYRKLSSTTCREFQDGIDVASLPPAFQEAGVLASTLGVHYLWIDSLCIEQDEDLRDWTREAPKMRQVYGHSFLNLAATLSSNAGTTSLFDTDTPSPFTPTPFEANRVKVQEYSRGSRVRVKGFRRLCLPRRHHHHHHRRRHRVYRIGKQLRTRIIPQQYYLMDGDVWEHEIEESILKSRAWVYQECLLPTRVLHFGKRQLAWECQESSALELFPGGLPPGLSPNPAPRHFSTALASRVGDPSHEGFREAWHHLVTIYSGCHLTKAEDKLIAMAGVAGRIEDARQDQYVAGLWKSTLIEDLAWTTISGLREGKGPGETTSFRAPSWSWLSLDAEISFPQDNTVGGYFAEILTHPDRTDAGSSVFTARGALGIAGVLLPLADIEHVGGRIDRFSVAGLAFEDGWTESASHLDLAVDPSEYDQLLHHHHQGGGVFVMPLYHSRTRIHGIVVVVAKPESGIKEYRRLGSVQIELGRHDLRSSHAWPGWERTTWKPTTENGRHIRYYVNRLAVQLFQVIQQRLSTPARGLIALA